MRLFQVGNIYPAHLNKLSSGLAQASTEAQVNAVILADVPQAQLLAPVVNNAPNGRLCFPQYEAGLRHWARDRGMAADAEVDDIVLAQIEDHRTEVFYSVNATRHSGAFLRRMPGHVRLTIGWLGSKIAGTGLPYFDAVVSNFRALNASHAKAGLKTYYLTPSYETQSDVVGSIPWADRHTDLFFAGTYSRHHLNRSRLIEALSRSVAAADLRAEFRLLNSRYTQLAEYTPLGLFPPFCNVRRPRSVRRLSGPPVFGMEMFGRIADTRLVLNMAIDIAGRDRGNMRCFESLSAGTLMISDDGDYPEGFVAGETHLTFQNSDQALGLVKMALAKPEEAQKIARSGWQMIRDRYSKQRQWHDFEELCASL